MCVVCGNQSGLATSHKLHGVAHLQLGRFHEADRYFRQGLELYEVVGDRRNAASMLNNLAESARMRLTAEETWEFCLHGLAAR